MVLWAAGKGDVSCTDHPVMPEQVGSRRKHGEGTMLVLKDPTSEAGELEGITY